MSWHNGHDDWPDIWTGHDLSKLILILSVNISKVEGEQLAIQPRGFLGSNVIVKYLEIHIIPYQQRILLHLFTMKLLHHCKVCFLSFPMNTATANSSHSRVSWVKASSTPSPDSSAAANKFRIFFVCNMRSLSCRWPPNWPLFFVSAGAHHRFKFKNLFYDRIDM